MLLGDLNGTMNDRSLAPVTSQMRSTQGAAGDGFGFSWPASFPMARIDQIMVKGMDPVTSWTLPADRQRPPSGRGVGEDLTSGLTTLPIGDLTRAGNAPFTMPEYCA